MAKRNFNFMRNKKKKNFFSALNAVVSLLKFRSWLVVELSCDQNDRRSARRIADLDLDPRPLLRPHAREANSVLAEQGGARGQVSRKFPLRQQSRLFVPVPAETREPHGRRPETVRRDEGAQVLRLHHSLGRRSAARGLRLGSGPEDNGEGLWPLHGQDPGRSGEPLVQSKFPQRSNIREGSFVSQG